MGSIRHTLRYLTSKRYRAEIQAENEISSYFARLEPCRGVVLIADPAFGEGEYYCSITIPNRELLARTQSRLENVVMPWMRKLVLQAFQAWLAKANPDDKGTSRLPDPVFQIIAPEIPEWVSTGKAKVWCHSCNSQVSNVTATETDQDQTGNSYYSWTSVWHCPAGHELYRKQEEMRLIRSGHRLNTYR